jgi:hypothetical protein
MGVVLGYWSGVGFYMHAECNLGRIQFDFPAFLAFLHGAPGGRTAPTFVLLRQWNVCAGAEHEDRAGRKHDPRIDGCHTKVAQVKELLRLEFALLAKLRIYGVAQETTEAALKQHLLLAHDGLYILVIALNLKVQNADFVLVLV